MATSWEHTDLDLADYEAYLEDLETARSEAAASEAAYAAMEAHMARQKERLKGMDGMPRS
jgi:hypothetical protein